MSTRIRFNAEKFTHDNYAATTTPQVRTLPKPCTAILVDNVDATATVYISFDAGVNYKSIKPSTALSLDLDNMTSYTVKSSTTSNVECLYASEI